MDLFNARELKDWCNGCSKQALCVFKFWECLDTCPCGNCLVKVTCNAWCDKKRVKLRELLTKVNDNYQENNYEVRKWMINTIAKYVK
jgi:hypothetical protein